MLHTLNKAWADILINQAMADPTKRIVFACTDEEYEEWDKYVEEHKPAGIVRVMWLSFIKEKMRDEIEIKKGNSKCRWNLANYDDILISHEIHDLMVKDFLGRHCKRKCC